MQVLRNGLPFTTPVGMVVRLTGKTNRYGQFLVEKVDDGYVPAESTQDVDISPIEAIEKMQIAEIVQFRDKTVFLTVPITDPARLLGPGVAGDTLIDDMNKVDAILDSEPETVE